MMSVNRTPYQIEYRLPRKQQFSFRHAIIDAIMKLTRSSRFIAALITLFSLLFTQLAMASYACPQLYTANHETVRMQDMSGCTGMTTQQSNLCEAHCDAGHQSLDAAAAPQVLPFIACQLALVLPSDESSSSGMAVPVASVPLTRTTAPPLTIRHCCFRI
jgi:hypothetical protein